MTENEKILRSVIMGILWMARRYAHNRRTFAASTVNEAIDICLRMGIKIEPDTVDGIGMYADDGDLGKWLDGRFEKETNKEDKP